MPKTAKHPPKKPAPAARRKVDPRWKAIGAQIAADREAAGMGQAELGRLVGYVVPGSMWRAEAGRSAIPIPRLERIAELLGHPPERYLPATLSSEQRPALSAEEQREMHARLARAAMAAALEGTPEAIEKLNELIAEHHRRTGR